MKIFFDCEFTGLRKHATLISIGLISEDGRTFYAEFNDYNQAQVNEWIQDNVIRNLIFKPTKEGEQEPYIKSKFKNEIWNIEMCGNSASIATELMEWLLQFDEVEIWGDCLTYDWVLLCELFDGAFGIPGNVYYIPFDICTLFKVKGIDPDINREEFVFKGQAGDGDLRAWKDKKHNALCDADIIKRCYKKLIKLH